MSEPYDLLLSNSIDAARAEDHARQAEQRCLNAARATADTPPIERVGVLGLGTMGVGISTALLAAGVAVVGVETSTAAAEHARGRIEANLSRMHERGKLGLDALNAAKGCLLVGTDRELLIECDAVIEAAFEDFELKKTLAQSLGDLLKPEALIASNTSTLDIDAIATSSGRPASVVGMHFFSPAHIMPLLEVIRGKDSLPATLAKACSLALQIGKVPVISGNCYGFIGNRMAEVYMRESEFLLLEGVAPARIDGVIQSARWLGMAMGPCRMLDMAGVDVGARTVIEQIKAGGFPPDKSYRVVCQALFELGRFGQKTGAGYYRYTDKHPIDDPAVEGLCEDLANEHGVPRRTDVSDPEIFERLFFPMVNEAARILEEGIADCASDIDVVWTLGYGFPKSRGGPLYLADQLGLQRLVSRLDRFAAERGNRFGYWDVAPLLRRLAEESRSFADLDSAKGH